MPNNKSSNKLTKQLGYEFVSVELLRTALTHRSVRSDPGNNERLEFLGDSILNFTIAEALFEKFPRAREGQLSRLRSNLVKGVTLAEIAREFELSNYIKLGPGEMKSGGHHRESILADTLEAIIAAIYLDSDISTTRNCILAWYYQRLQQLELDQDSKDPKTKLQEYLQAKRMRLPKYTVTAAKGKAHEQEFTIQCAVYELNLTTTATGNSRRKAETQAAASMLQLLTTSKSGVDVND